jgi:YVTN family beta-propeller protein
VLHRRISTAVFLCVLEGLLLAPPVRASHAYAMTCCNVPSSVTVIDRATHAVAGTLIAGQGAAFVLLSRDGKTTYVANENDSTISVLDAATGVQTALISLRSYGASPYGAVLSQDGTQLYVTAAQDGYIGVLGIDTANNSVEFDVQTPAVYEGGNSPTPGPPPVLSSDGQSVYILAGELMTFDVTSFATQTITIPSGIPGPQGLAVTPDGAYAILTFNEGRQGFNEHTGQLALVDLSSKTVVKQVIFPSSKTVGSVVSSPEGSLAYFPLNSSGNVAIEVFDITSRQIVRTFPAGRGSGNAIAITPDGAEVELAESSATVLSMKAATGAVIAQTGALGQLVSITLSSDGSRIYVPNFNSSMLEIIDPETSQLSGQIPAGWTNGTYDTNYALTVSADGRRIAVAGALNFTFIDTVTQRVMGTVPFTTTSFGSVTLSPDGNRAYAIMGGPAGGAPRIQVIDTKALTVTGVVNLTGADAPQQAAVSPDGSTLYVGERYCPSGGSCVPRMLEIDTATLTVAGQIVLSTSEFTPGGIAISQDGATAYVEGLYFSGGVSVVDLTEGQVVATIPAQFGGGAIALARNQRFLYEFAPTNYFYYLIDLPAQKVTPVPDNVGVGWGYASDMALSPDGRLIYLTSETESYIVAFSTYPNGAAVFLGTINLPSASDGVVFSPI